MLGYSLQPLLKRTLLKADTELDNFFCVASLSEIGGLYLAQFWLPQPSDIGI
jgi:hypothetical protein